MTRRDLPLAALALALSACADGCEDETFEVDVCGSPREGSIDSVEVGRGLTAIYMPFASGDTVHLIQANNLLFTLPIRYRFTGSDVPACVLQEATVRGCPGGVSCADGPIQLGRAKVPLWTYPEEDGSFETRALHVVLEGGDPDHGGRLELRAEAAGQTIDVALFVDEVPQDGAPPIDAVPPIDGGDDPIDAAPPIDAASVDASPADAGP